MPSKLSLLGILPFYGFFHVFFIFFLYSNSFSCIVIRVINEDLLYIVSSLFLHQSSTIYTYEKKICYGKRDERYYKRQ